ncbi:RodZ domain-containing protein [Maritimibacter sp. UBA3975]|uniref:helix-turn-helix domain-containing protein n=2 Tax=Maritimibacter TaxID=404235 RepID=UPI0025BBD9AD|nr:RodZ domain-containing protein [Maritimibacter sp. UBA3975]|tara:strand:+ start:48393 stop:49613 length:1221 start_codon:yes stop_codon:yes gene_type:complete
MIRRWITPPVREEEQPSGFDSFELRLGDVMRGERATLGKSLLDVQRELKIKATYISAIENADVTAFETPGFIAGYVRSYARYLGLDPEWAFKVFCRESGFETAHGLSPSASIVAKPEKVRDPDSDPLANPNASFVPRPSSIFEGIEPGAVGSVGVLVAIVGILGFGGYSLLQEIQKVDFAPVEQSVGVLEDLPELDTPIGPTDGETVRDVAGLNSPPSVESLDRMYRPEALDVPVLIARDGPISTLDPREVGVMPELAGNRRPDRPNTPARPGTAIDSAVETAVADASGAVRVFGPDAPDVAIFAVRPSWVRVQSADGSILFEKILDAGERYVLPKTEQPPLLRTGNAGSVYFAVNGSAYGPAGEGASVVSNVALAPESIHESYAVADAQADQALADFIAVADASE